MASVRWAFALLVLCVQVFLTKGTLTRKNVEELTDQEVLRLQNYLGDLVKDKTATGFQALAAYHGEPSMCQDASGNPQACCLHGMAVFPQWHRLYVVQFEQLLYKRGLDFGVPYWDTTEILTHLPRLVEDEIFRDPSGGLGRRNAWFSSDINLGSKRVRTARAVDERLFEHVEPGQNTQLFNIILDALEQEDYCQFEVQFEVAHNHIHYLVGGRHRYSMSTLEYSSYDPIFFLHHSSMDRIFVIWQQLQKRKGKPYESVDCSVEQFQWKLRPFDRESNPVELTHTYSQPKDLFNHFQLGYWYDDIKLHGMNLEALESLLEQRHARERSFAVFSLHGLGFSANVRVKVCDKGDTNHCEFAGDFFLLGGANEMPWEFHLPYYFDVSDAVQRLGVALDGAWEVKAELFHVNGTALPSNLIPKPYGSHRPPAGYKDAPEAHTPGPNTLVRKDIEVLTDEEIYELRLAMSRFQNDTSVDGYQAVAEFHGLPARCPRPDAAVRYACCIHGLATFPHWHRLFVVQVEDELRARGLHFGIPYWDWTRPKATVPALAADATYEDPRHPGTELHNPFYDAAIAFLGKTTARQVKPQLFQDPAFGDHTELFDGILLAFEQTDFCDFEIQFEVVHNAPHFLVGGFTPYSLSTLHYSAFDPIFYLHHSNVDRLWAIWQKLQIRRGLNYRAHCANTMTQDALKPFSFDAPLNSNDKTRAHSHPKDVYFYQKEFDYMYDTMTFGGMTIEQLENYLRERQSKERAFVGIELHNIGVSAWVEVYVNSPGGQKYLAGHVAVLGGEKEMPWHFDRLFKLEITDALFSLGLQYDDDFSVSLNITDVNGKHWPDDTFSHSTIFHDPPHTFEDSVGSDYTLRTDIESLTREQVQNLREALLALKKDSSVTGSVHIAAFHGQPKWCPSPDAEKKFACCVHGMPTFPHWHRLFTVQAENSLRNKGYKGGLPYWDWTLPMKSLPAVVIDENYIHPATGKSTYNPFNHGLADGQKTTRDPQSALFEQPAFGKFTRIAEQVMLAFEQTDYCDFEVQFEVAHNYIHALVGGVGKVSMASLRYSAYDPIFYLHHSNTDRIWAIWQELQSHRGLPYNTANCAISAFRKPMQPFAQTSEVNPDAVTRDHSVPFDVFNYRASFHYKYDNFQFNGLSVPQIQHEVSKRQAHERVFAGFMLHGIGQSAMVVFEICAKDACKKAGEFYILGDQYEMPWAFDRLFKYEITQQLQDQGLEPSDRYSVQYKVMDLAGQVLNTDDFGSVTLVHTYGAGHVERKSYEQELKISSHVRRNIDDLREGEKESLKTALRKMEEDGSFEHIARFHGAPGLCKHNGNKVGCCVHGKATFPHWHRLYVEQVENELLSHGSAVSMPYWDWTKPIKDLPDLISQPTYFDSRSQQMEPNPFFHHMISAVGAFTTREPRAELFNSDYFLQQTLLALEQTSYCDFEVQFEITHNAFHSYLGGRGKYSLSTLDYSAFDPVFFLYHANTDRIWAIWQALQSQRGLPWDEADCALNYMREPLQPFNDREKNNLDVTHKNSRPVDVWDYSDHLDYHYDDLLFNDWTIPQLQEVLHTQRSRDRLFAGLLLHNIGTSADVELFICVGTGTGRRSCDHPAGKFSVLGGQFEMPFNFDRLYKFDISDPVRKLGLKLDSGADFDLKVQIHAFNGSYLDPSILNEPTIIFVPGEKNYQNDKGRTERKVIRRNVLNISVMERRSLVLALRNLQEDNSPDGFQSLASFHALPELCPYPEATNRFACCVHGSPAFPHWHRLYLVQFEEALRRHGSLVGIPYWDTTRAQSKLPDFLSADSFHDPFLGFDFPNRWRGADIEFENSHTERDVDFDRLNEQGNEQYGNWYGNWMREQYLMALEQEDYCDFEVQFEIAHNAIHAWVGGSKLHSMAHLHYASYDPLFLLHHSNTDRIFALWQELQRLRGRDPNTANCALEVMHEPLKPFSFGSPYNLNPNTKRYSRPEDIFDYREHFHYDYDSLEIEGLAPDILLQVISYRKAKERVFAGFLLRGLGTSAHVEFSVCDDKKVCTRAGDFNVLGGSAEMPWRFDRTYKYDITRAMKEANIDATDSFIFKVAITALNGTMLDSRLLPEPIVIIQHANEENEESYLQASVIRHSLSDLTERDIMSLKSALHNLQDDSGRFGWQALTSFHGVPALCPTPAEATFACCIHGMPTFPHWHRLYTLTMEHALRNKGSAVSLPYWDWTLPMDKLPKIFTEETYYDAWKDEVFMNPFSRSYVKEADGHTVRDPQPELWKVSKDGKNSALFEEVLLALEQTDFCDFEVQFEVTHNAIHYLVGGPQTYSLSSLHYSSYDPIFFVHHSFVDKIWAVWQEMQRRRGKPHNRADCAVNYMHEPMHPFDSADLNPDPLIRVNAVPQKVFSTAALSYGYDNFDIGGHSIPELEDMIHARQSHPRVFAGFHLRGIRTSADVVFHICSSDRSINCSRAGAFFILGGEKEMSWEFDRLYKYDITDALHDARIDPEDVFNTQAPFHLAYEVHDVIGKRLPDSTISTPTIIFEPARGADPGRKALSTAGVSVRKNVNDLTSAERQSLKDSLRNVMSEPYGLNYQKIASWHGWPGLCELDGKKVACCHHGMASFPQWHRLYVRMLELAMTWQGAQVGIPYWEWTEAFTELPTLVTDDDDNPFHHGVVEELHKTTSRAPRPQLFKDPEHGEESFFYRQILLAFEQRDYCDFEVQFEITHNAIHSWIGGSSPYGMSTLEFSSFDPIFFLHHSNVDRQFAIWQALQKYRGLDYDTANCNIQELRRKLEPFSWPVNPITTVRENARAIGVFSYDQYSYQYDDLNFHGMTIPELEALLEERRREDHVFLNFMLQGIGTSADVTFDICDSNDRCNFGGTFAILGGPLEMPWSFDRLFKYDVTSVFRQMHLRPDSDYHVQLHITAVNGTELRANLIDAPSVSFLPGKSAHRPDPKADAYRVTDFGDLVRSEVSSLTLEKVTNFKNALYKLQNDHGPNGFEAIASFHGAPGLCPENSDSKYACCQHGMPVFPHWHRLLTVQFERALKAKGSVIGVPYWDWTRPASGLPQIFSDPFNINPFMTYEIQSAGHFVERDVQNDTIAHVTNEHNSDSLFHQALETLEESSYCDFEVQFEMLHNAVHFLVGGNKKYSMSTLEYSAFDPFFMVHHSAIDRIWRIWQELQRIRQKPFNFAHCAKRYLMKPLEPFSYASVNADELTRSNAEPLQIFDTSKFSYHYDSLDLGGHSVKNLNEMILDMRSQHRLFAGFVLAGLGTSASVRVDIDHEGQREQVGTFYVLGGQSEMPWAYERVYKLDMTEAANRLHLDASSVFNFQLTVTQYDGTPLSVAFPTPLVIDRPANADYDVLILPLNPSNDLPPKIVVRKGTKIRFQAADAAVTQSLRELGSYTNMLYCSIPPGDASTYNLNVEYSLEPGEFFFVSGDEEMCKDGSRLQITVDVE